jgi:type I restriction enzyme S subunit
MSFKSLGELAQIKGGKRLPKGSQLQTIQNSHPYIRVRDMGNRLLPDSGLEYVPDDVFPKISRYIVNTNDVIISIVGTIGLVSMVDERFDNASQTENCAKISGFDQSDASYLYYFLTSKLGQEEIKKGTVGAVQAKLPLYSIEKINVYWPERIIREQIVLQLLSLDKKIELNRQINQTLEDMAQALFKSWFVDFEPVKAKIAAKERWHAMQPAGEFASPACSAEQPEPLPTLEDYMNLAAMQAISGKTAEQLQTLKTQNPDQYQQLHQTAQLFPDAMQDSELGEIPEGWGVSTVGEEFDVTMGQSPPGESYNESGEGVVFFQGRRDFGWRYPENRIYTTEAKRMANKGDTLLSVRAPVGDINKAKVDCCVGRGLAAIRHKSGCESFTYYSMWNLAQQFNSFDSEGTVFGSINQKDLKSLKTIKFSNHLLVQFSKVAENLDKQIQNYEAEMSTLVCLRDNLLPKLLSGELEIPIDNLA